MAHSPQPTVQEVREELDRLLDDAAFRRAPSHSRLLRYLVDVTNPSLWDDSFAEAFAARIAWAIGEKIAGSAYNVGDGWAFYQSLLSKSKSTDARENPPLAQEESDWITARWGYGTAGTRRL